MHCLAYTHKVPRRYLIMRMLAEITLHEVTGSHMQEFVLTKERYMGKRKHHRTGKKKQEFTSLKQHTF